MGDDTPNYLEAVFPCDSNCRIHCPHFGLFPNNSDALRLEFQFKFSNREAPDIALLKFKVKRKGTDFILTESELNSKTLIMGLPPSVTPPQQCVPALQREGGWFPAKTGLVVSSVSRG